MTITTSQHTAWLAQRNGTAKPARAKRGYGTVSERKAQFAARLKRALEVLGCEVLPQGITVRLNPGPTNQWERYYAKELKLAKDVGFVADYEFGLLRFDLGGAKYTPDFVVRHSEAILDEKLITMCEVKGRRCHRIDVFKIAREKYPQFDWFIMEKIQGKFRPMRLYGGTK